VVIGGENVLLLSAILFGIGYIGLLRQPNVVKSVIAVEIMIFASVVNFAFFSGTDFVRSGHVAMLIAVTIGCLVWAVVFSIISLQVRGGKNPDVSAEEKQ
jgi:NADH:ubiquinone oxidoreductase subunit K